MKSNLQKMGRPFWLDIQHPEFPVLDANVAVEAVVVGAGIAGLKIARALNRRGIETVLLESAQVGDGASGRNQGSINHGPGVTYTEFLDRHPRDTARQLWCLGLENHRLLREQISEYQINCDYQVDGMTSLIRRDQSDWQQLAEDQRREAELLTQDGFDVCFLDEQSAVQAGGNSIYASGLRYNTDAQFHSGRFVVGLAEAVSALPRVTLYHRSPVESIRTAGNETSLLVNGFELRTRLVFLSTNALVPQFIPDLARPLRAERGQVFVTEPMLERPCRGSFGTAMAWWREILEHDGRFRLLFGGGRTRDEPDSLFPQFADSGHPNPRLSTDGFRPSTEHQQRLDAQFALLFPELSDVQITHRWGGLQSFTADELPQIGLFDSDRRIYGMAGFSGRGNCYADVGAEYLAALAAGGNHVLSSEMCQLIETLMAPRRPAANWDSEWIAHSHG